VGLLEDGDVLWVDHRLYWVHARGGGHFQMACLWPQNDDPHQTVTSEIIGRYGLVWDHAVGWTDGTHPETPRNTPTH
jgi:hypothetical protein